jgi:hypothetical protein
MDSRTKRAWAGLVSYANGTATDAQIRATVAACIGWISAVTPFGLNPASMSDEEVRKQAEEYRPEVDKLLRLLCSGPEDHKVVPHPFLFEHGQHIASLALGEVNYSDEKLRGLSFTPAERERFKEETEIVWNSAQYSIPYTVDGVRRQRLVGTNFLPLGIYVPAREYQDLADPICDFLMSEYLRALNKYIDRYSSRRDKKPAPIVPIFVCPRCNKLVMPERTGRKQYCSECTDLARAQKYREKAPAEEGRDYQWLYRLRGLEPNLRRIRLRSPKGRERLQEIKARQRNSSRCQRLILEMKL